MTQNAAVRTVHIRGVSEGLDRLEQDLRAVGDAQENLAKTSETTARTTETTSRRQISAAGAYDRLRNQIDQQYRAQRQLERGQQTLDRAFQQGLATQAEYDRAMAQLRERYLAASAANDNFRAANDNAARSVEQSTGLIDRLKSSVSQLVLAYAGMQGLRLLGDTADQWSEIQARVVNATGSFEAGQAVLGRLGEMARRTYSDLDRTAESWLSSSRSLSAFGVSIGDQLDLVESFNNALVISATRGQRAESVQRAWSDAMALGKMNMQQFNTIMTGSDRLAQALADSMGVNVIELRKMAAEGKITRREMLGLSSQLETLREEADRMPATIADGVTLIRNALLMTIGMMDQAGGASESFAAGLVIIADNMQRIVTYAATAATAYGTYYVGAMVAARLSTIGLTGALALLRAALIRTGIGALVVGAGELIYQFGRLVEATGSFSGALTELGRRGELVFDAIRFGFFAMTEAMKATWYTLMAEILRATEETFAPILRYFGVSAETMSSAIEDAAHRADEWGKIAASSATIAAGQFQAAFAEIKVPEIDLGGSSASLADNLDKADKNAKKLAEAYKRIVDSAQDFIRQQQLEASLIGMSEQAANALRYEFELLNEARRAGISLTEADKAGFKALAEVMAEAEERTRFLKEAFDFVHGTIKGFFSDLRSGLKEGKSFWEAFADAGVSALEKIADKLIDMALDQMINNVLRNLAGALNFGGGFGGGTSYFPPAPSVGFHTFADGGRVHGPGSSTSDSIPAWLSDGEFVVRAAAVAQPGVLPMLEAINSGMALRMATGGLARIHSPANPAVQRFSHGGLARSQPAADGNAALNVRVEVQNNTSAQVEVGEPRQEGGELVLPMVINQVVDAVAGNIASNGKVGRAVQQTFGLKRVTR